MPVLYTPRLTCSPVQEEDWPFFLSLQQHPDVMRFVAEARPEEAIREAFTARLPAWTPGSDHWLCLVVRDNLSQMPLGVTGYIHHDDDCAEVGFLFAPQAQGKGYGFESLQAVCDYAFGQGGIRRLTATDGGQRGLETPAGKSGVCAGRGTARKLLAGRPMAQ